MHTQLTIAVSWQNLTKNFSLIYNSIKQYISVISSDFLLTRNLDEPLQIKTKSKNISPFIFSTATGLYLYHENQVSHLLKGRFFGISRASNNIFFVYQQFSSFGIIRKIWLSNNSIVKTKIINKNLPKNIHQICFFDESLHVCDTANNRILKLNVDGKELNSIYPKGKLQNGKKSDNYSHFNSIYPYKNRIFIIAHNYSQYSGRNSQIIILNRSSNELEKIIDLDAKCAHNYLIKNNSIFICDSQNGSLLIDTKSKIKLNYFLRGIAADANSMIVGGSMYGKRAERIGKDCFIFIYDNNINIIDEIKLNNIGPVFDIRFLNNDLGDGNE